MQSERQANAGDDDDLNDRNIANENKKSFLFVILSNAVLIAMMTLVVKTAAMTKEILVAQHFGISGDLDCYLMAYMLPQVLINIIAGSYATSFLPAFSKALHSEGKRYAQAVLQESTLILTVLLALFSVLIYTALPWLLPLIASGFSPNKLLLTESLAHQLLPVISFNGLSLFFASVLNTKHRYILPALLPVLTPLAIIFALVGFENLGIETLAMGTLSGAALELIFLFLALKKAGWAVKPVWHTLLPETRQIIQQFKPMIIGALVMNGTDIVDQSMAAMTGMPSGSVAALSYGNKVIAVILGLGSTALGTAFFSHFSEMIANQQWQQAFRLLNQSFKLVFLLTLPVVGLLFVYSEDIVSLIYQRGQFSSEDATLVAQIQSYYGLQIPFYISGIIGVRMLNAMRKNHSILKIAIINLIANIISNLALIKSIGLPGIALSTSLVYAISLTQIMIYIYSARKHLA